MPISFNTAPANPLLLNMMIYGGERAAAGAGMEGQAIQRKNEQSRAQQGQQAQALQSILARASMAQMGEQAAGARQQAALEAMQSRQADRMIFGETGMMPDELNMAYDRAIAPNVGWLPAGTSKADFRRIMGMYQAGALSPPEGMQPPGPMAGGGAMVGPPAPSSAMPAQAGGMGGGGQAGGGPSMEDLSPLQLRKVQGWQRQMSALVSSDKVGPEDKQFHLQQLQGRIQQEMQSPLGSLMPKEKSWSETVEEGLYELPDKSGYVVPKGMDVKWRTSASTQKTPFLWMGPDGAVDNDAKAAHFEASHMRDETGKIIGSWDGDKWGKYTPPPAPAGGGEIAFDKYAGMFIKTRAGSKRLEGLNEVFDSDQEVEDRLGYMRGAYDRLGQPGQEEPPLPPPPAPGQGMPGAPPGGMFGGLSPEEAIQRDATAPPYQPPAPTIESLDTTKSQVAMSKELATIPPRERLLTIMATWPPDLGRPPEWVMAELEKAEAEANAGP